MKRVQHVGVMVMLAALAAFAQSALAETITVGDSGFETYSLGSSTMAYTTTFGSLPTTIGSWTFGVSAGPSYNGLVKASSGFGNVAVFDSQAAFIQGTGKISQTISGFSGGSYTVSFYMEARSGGSASVYNGQPLAVTIDGTTVTFSGSSTVSPASKTAMTLVTSDVIMLGAGSHTLTFTGTIPYTTSDTTDFIDNVRVAAVPEPKTAWLLGIGSLGLLACAWRKRRKPICE